LQINIGAWRADQAISPAVSSQYTPPRWVVEMDSALVDFGQFRAKA
jgi:hypothetical protein